jgi:hypothetical protein
MDKALSRVVILLSLLMCGCDLSNISTPSDNLKDEAYAAGWNSVWREKCRGIDPPLMMPKKYDDSTSKGQLVQYYRSGMYDASVNPRLCD